MNDNFIKKATRLSMLPDCFIKRDDNYTLTMKDRMLPVVPKKYRRVLQKIKGIQYEHFDIYKNGEKSTFIRYWEWNNYDDERITLPVYEYNEKNRLFEFKGMYEGYAPTKETVEAAKRKAKIVDAEVTNERRKELISFLEEEMANRNALYINTREVKKHYMEGRVGHFYLFYINRLDGSHTNHLIAFDLDKIYIEQPVVELPKSDFKFILGKYNCNIVNWRRTLKVDDVEVVVKE